jgi:hypothetical protein
MFKNTFEVEGSKICVESGNFFIQLNILIGCSEMSKAAIEIFNTLFNEAIL